MKQLNEATLEEAPQPPSSPSSFRSYFSRAFKSVFAQKPKTRSRRRSLGGIETLESREMLSAVPAAISSYDTYDTLLDNYQELATQQAQLQEVQSQTTVLFDGNNFAEAFTKLGSGTLGENFASLGTNSEAIFNSPYDLSDGPITVEYDVKVSNAYDIAELLTNASNSSSLRGGNTYNNVYVSTYNQVIVGSKPNGTYEMRRPSVSAGAVYHVKLTQSRTELDVRVTGNGIDEHIVLETPDAADEPQYLRLWSKYHNTFSNMRISQERPYDPSTDIEQINDEIEEISDEVLNLLAQNLIEQPESEESNENMYARMLVTVPTDAGLNLNPVSVRYRSPHNQTYFELTQWATRMNPRVMHSKIVEHTGGTEDASYEFSFDVRSYNNADSAWELTMWSDPNKTEMLDRIVGTAKTDTSMQQVRIATAQDAWEEVDVGRMKENPIEPRLHIARLDGPNIQLQFQSPFDESHIEIEGDGLLARSALIHEGGTSFDMTQITINGSLQSGVYTATLYSKLNGMPLDSVRVVWNKDTKMLSLPDGEMPWQPVNMATELEALAVPLSGDPAEDTMRVLEHESRIIDAQTLYDQMNDGSQRLRTTFLSSSSLRFQQESLLYEQSEFFVPIETVTYDYFFTKYPHYHPDNFEQHMNAMSAEYPTFTRAQLEDSHHKNMLRDLHEVTEGLIGYAEVSGHVLQAGIEVYLAVERGEPQEYSQEVMRQVYDRFKNQRLSALLATGFAIPSIDEYLQEAHRMLRTEQTASLLESFQNADDRIDIKAHEAVMYHLNDLQARAQYNAEFSKNYDAVQPTVEEALARQEYIAAHTQQLRTLAAIDREVARANDPRIQRIGRLVEAATGAGSTITVIVTDETDNIQRLRSEESGNISLTMTTEELLTLREQLVFGLENSNMNQLSMATSGAIESVVESSLQQVLSFQEFSHTENETFGEDILTYLQSPQGKALMTVMRLNIPKYHADIINAYDSDAEVFPLPLKADSHASRILRSVYQGFHQTRNGSTWNGETRASLAMKASVVSGLPVADMLNIAFGNDELLAANLKRLFGAKGINLDASEVGPSIGTDGVVDEDGMLRIHIDVPLSIANQEAAVTLLNADYETVAHTAYYGDTLYVDVALQSSEVLIAKLSYRDLDGTIVTKYSEEFVPRSAPIIGPQPQELLNIHSLDDDDFTEAQRNELANILDVGDTNKLPENNRLILEELVDRFVVSATDDDRLTKISDTEWRSATLHNTGDKQCKQWLQEDIILAATGISINQNETVENESARWKNSEDLEVMRQVADTEDAAAEGIAERNFEDAFKNSNILPGDVIQMYNENAGWPHTMVLGKIEEGGIWVFDTNYGGRMPDGTNDNTVRYHYIDFEKLGQISKSTIYRINE